jgi:hemerythrin-like metal-binding protein
LTHFKYEEQRLRDHEYPGLAVHQLLHDKLRQRTIDLRDNANLMTGKDLLRYLKEWWCDHIQGEDKKYAPYVQQPVASR